MFTLREKVSKLSLEFNLNIRIFSLLFSFKELKQKNIVDAKVFIS